MQSTRFCGRARRLHARIIKGQCDGATGARGVLARDGAATGKDIGCAYRTVAAQETSRKSVKSGFQVQKRMPCFLRRTHPRTRDKEYKARSRDADTSTWGHPSTWPNDKIESSLCERHESLDMEARKDVQAPATPQPVAKVTVQQAPAADALKALEEDGSDSDDDNHMAKARTSIPITMCSTPEPSAAESIDRRTEGGEPELRSVPSGPPTSRGQTAWRVWNSVTSASLSLKTVKAHKDACDSLQSFKAV